MRKICIINQKGGVGKTTTAVSLAAGLSRKDKRVLLLDLDSHSQVATCLASESNKNMYDLLIENAELAQCITHLGKNLDAINACEDLEDAEKIISQESEGYHVLKNKLEDLEGYDYVIIDCPPLINTITINAILFSDEMIIPSATDVLSYDGLKKMIKSVKRINSEHDHNIKITKIVPTLHDARNKICKKVLSDMQNEFYEIVADPIRINAKLKEAPLAKKSIFSYDKSSRGAKDYELLVKAIINGEAAFASKKTEQKVVAVA